MANNTKNTTTITFSKKTIALIVAAVGVLLIFIGLFGDCLKPILKEGTTTIEGDALNLKFFFKTGWEGLPDGVTGIGFIKFMLVLSIISFFAGVLGIVGISGKCAYSLYKKEDAKIGNSIALSIVAGLQYVFVVKAVYAASVTVSATGYLSESVNYSLGWGTILIIAGFFISLIAFIINESEEKKILTASGITLKIGVLLAFFIVLFGSAIASKIGIKVIDSGLTERESIEIGVFGWLETILINLRDHDSFSKMKAFGIISLILTMISFISLGTLIYYLIKDDVETDGKKLISVSACYFLSMILANVMLIVSVKPVYDNLVDLMSQADKATTSLGLGTSAIVATVLGGLLVVASIVAVKLNGKTVKFTKSK